MNRLVIEDKEATLYYTLQNSKVYQEKDLLGIQIHQDVSKSHNNFDECLTFLA